MESFASEGPNRPTSGRYRLNEPIGHGGMATVYRGQDEALGRDIAVKLFRASAVAPDDVGRQETEMRLLASLSHPGLVTLFDAGKDDAGRDDGEAGEPRAFLVMELVEGPDLRKRLREEDPLSPADVAYIGAELAGALAYIHGRGVIHRDVKPANILLPPIIAGTLPRAKLTDFGIARMLDGDRMTAANATLGTANYLSPEQASGQDVGFSSDIYSLGLVLLEAVTGRIEYGGSAVEAALARLSRSPDVPEALGHYWCSLLEAMTDRDPDQRPTAAEVSAQLLEYRWSALDVLAPVQSLARVQAEDTGEHTGAETGGADDGGPATADSGTDGPEDPAACGPAADIVPDPDPDPDPVPLPDPVEVKLPSGPLLLVPPQTPPKIGPGRLQAAAARAASLAIPRRPSKLVLAGRTLLGLVAVAVLTMTIMAVADRMGIFPQDQGYPAVPGQLGEHLRELQESVNP